MNPWAVAFIAGAVTVVSIVGIVSIGAHVVQKYPSTYDPARNARRFTVPVLTLAVVGLFALVASLIAVGVAITTP